MLNMRRRQFISLLGGAAAAWPLVVRAQHPGKLPTIGFLGTTDPSSMRPWITAFVERLRDLGWIEDRTIAIAYRWAEGHPERYAEIAAEFVRLNVNVIVTTGPAAPQAKLLALARGWTAVAQHQRSSDDARVLTFSHATLTVAT
jgi:hypothetical protein